MLREDLAPSWMQSPLSLEETAVKFIRPHLRDVFVNLIKNPIEEYLYRFNFKSERVMAMYGITDAFSGLFATFGTPGTQN